MKTFIDLWEESKELQPTDNGGYVRERLSEALSNTGMEIRSLNEPGPREPTRVLIGVGFYSLRDLQLLDALVEKFCDLKAGEHIELFDVLACPDMSSFDQFVPGIGKVYQTPVLGIWQDGVLVEKAWGVKARQLLIQRYKLNL